MNTITSWMKSLYDWWTTSRYLKGGRLNSVEMTNIDMKQVMNNITSQPYDIVKYSDLTKYVNKQLPTFLIILFNYPDSQWPYLDNPANAPERNGDIRDSECGELVIFRVMYIDLSDYEFMSLCIRIGGHQLFDLVSKLDKPKYKIVKEV